MRDFEHFIRSTSLLTLASLRDLIATNFIGTRVFAGDKDAPFQHVEIDFDPNRNLPCPSCGSRVYASWWPQIRDWELTECIKCGAVFYSWFDVGGWR
jgi:hypothetical protein